MDARRFFYTCAGILLIVAAYSIGAERAHGQSTNRIVGITDAVGTAGGAATHIVAVTETGDWYYKNTNSSNWTDTNLYPWTLGGNIFTNVGVEARPWSSVKDAYRK